MRTSSWLALLVVARVLLVSGDTWIWSAPTTAAPQPRFQHSANRVRNQLFVYGGSLTNEIPEATLHVLNMDNMMWSTPAVSGDRPISTTGHSSFVHKDLLYLVFGSDGRSVHNKVFQLDTQTFRWSRTPMEGGLPSPRTYHSTVLADDGRAIVFGGYDGQYYLNDLYTWTVLDETTNATGAWLKITQNGTVPDVRASASMAVYGRKLFLFGGFEIAVYKNDFYWMDLDTHTWFPVQLAQDHQCALPSARAMASMTLVGTRLFLFGGIFCHSNGTCITENDVHSFDIYKNVMVPERAKGVIPPARYGHSATLFGSKIVVFAGASWPNLYNDVLLYDVYSSEWSVPAVLPPYSRKHHSLNYFQPLNADGSKKSAQLVVFGGRHGSGGYSQHLHFYDLETSQWHHPTSRGPVPAIGHHASAVRDDLLYVFGGYNGSHSSNDLLVCDLDVADWRKLDVDGRVPKPCHGHAIVESAGGYLQFGGVDCVGDQCTFSNEVHSLSIESLSWREVETRGSIPRPRASHTWTTISPSSHVVFGGIGALFSNLDDLYVFDEFSSSWQFVNTKGQRPAARFGHSAVAHDGKLIVFGGASCRDVKDCTYFNDAFMFVPPTRTWTKLDIQGSYPASREGHAAVMVGGSMYLFGGASGNRVYNELLVVHPAPPVAVRSIVYGPGKTGASVGEAVVLFVQLQDSFGANRTSGGDDVYVGVSPEALRNVAKLTAPIEIVVEDQNNGLYKISFNSTVADTYNVSISVNSESLKPFQIPIVAGPAVGSASKAKGAGLASCIAGEECEFVVELFDAHSNRVQRKEFVDVVFTGPRRIVKRVKDSGTGQVKVRYTAEKAGAYTLQLVVGGQRVTGGPFALNVSVATPSARTSRLTGPGLEGARAGETGNVLLTVMDKFDNFLNKGGQNVKAQLVGPDELACAVVDHLNGTFSISYTAVRTGSYRLNVVLNGDLVEGCPFDVTIHCAPLSPATTFAYGEGLRRAVAGRRTYFTIQAADDFANNLTVGGAQFNVLYAGPGNSKQICNVTDHADGRYTVTYRPRLSGDFMISATLWSETLGYQSIHLSPFLGFTVAAGVDPKNSFVFTDDISKPVRGIDTAFSAVMGVHSFFKIQAVDRAGNYKSVGGDKFGVELEGPVEHDGFIGDNGDGTYTGSFVAPAPGRFWLKVFYGAELVSGTPIPVDVASNFDACPNACSKRGECKANVCVCADGFAGADCSVETGSCPSNCMGNGACLNNTCFCFPGYVGASCERRTTLCPNDCSRHGECLDTLCVCDEGYTGKDCSDNLASCPDACSSSGECVDGRCLCYPGFIGANCGERRKFCPNACTGRGTCMPSGMCQCHTGWTGLTCSDSIAELASLSQESKSTTTVNQALVPEELPARLPRP